VSAVCGRAAYEYIERGVRLAQDGSIAAIVTAPVNKEALAAAGVRHSGHTEILAELTGTKAYAMLLMGKELRVIHVTTHVALRRVPDLVTRERVLRTIKLGDQAMRDLGIARPRIAVCGLNPTPARAVCSATRSRSRSGRRSPTRAEGGVDATGPYPADTLMSRAAGGEFDCVVAMFHDQGHTPVKALGFRYDDAKKAWTGLSGVNVTVGPSHPPGLRGSRHRLRPRGQRDGQPREHGGSDPGRRRNGEEPRARGDPSLTLLLYRIAVIGGDGIGPEVMAEALRVLRAVAVPGRLELAFDEVEAGADCYRRTGEELPRETLEVCQAADAILFGAAGLPDVRFPTGPRSRPSSRCASRSTSIWASGHPASPGRCRRRSARREGAHRLRDPAREHRGALCLARGGHRGGRPGRDRHARRDAAGGAADLPPGVRAGAPTPRRAPGTGFAA
jgi:hypothetical protein